MLGQVIGINSAIATTGGTTGGDQAGNIGVGFAIPIEQVKITADQILQTGEARYPVIGAKVQTGQRDGSGAEIDEVIDDTPADHAGLESGDVVVALDGHKVTDGIALIVSIRSHQPGETLTFTVLRDGDQKDLDITLDSEVG
jgi:putative serine protease PepD